MLPIIANNVKVDEVLAGKTYDLYRAAMSSDGTISEDLQRKSLEVYLRMAGVKTAPPLERFYDFGATRRLYMELNGAGRIGA